jgi:hypothetical protein
VEACIRWAVLKYAQKNVHDAQKNVHWDLEGIFKNYKSERIIQKRRAAQRRNLIDNSLTLDSPEHDTIRKEKSC